MLLRNKRIPFYLKLFNSFQEVSKASQLDGKEENVTSVVYRLMRNARIEVTFSSLCYYLKSHPNYPYLKSVCDYLNDINVTNYALRIEDYDLFNLKEPFIAHVKEFGGKVLMVYSVNKKFVVYTDSLRGKKIMTTEQFLEKWDRAVILIEPTEFSGENGYKENRGNELVDELLLPFAIFAFIVAIMFGIMQKGSLISTFKTSQLVLLFTHIAGLFFSVLLFRNELDLKTRLSDKLCHIATYTDCDAVTKSKASKVFGKITWADIGVTYFAGGIISAFIVPNAYVLNNLALLGVISVPYPVFSILYQWLEIKKWCPFCLVVQSILIVEAITFFGILSVHELNFSVLVSIMLIFSMVFLILILWKSFFVHKKEEERFKMELLKIKRDHELFRLKLDISNRMDFPMNKYALVFGKEKNETLVSVFLSFDCSACARKFSEIKSLIKNNSKINIQLIFSPAKNEISTKLFMRIIGFMKMDKREDIMDLLDKWYNASTKYRIKLYAINGPQDTISDFDKYMEYNSVLFKERKISHVPSTYVNGYPLPEIYSLDDIKYHVSELVSIEHKPMEANHCSLINT